MIEYIRVSNVSCSCKIPKSHCRNKTKTKQKKTLNTVSETSVPSKALIKVQLEVIFDENESTTLAASLSADDEAAGGDAESESTQTRVSCPGCDVR